MSSAFTYSQLVAAIQTWTEDDSTEFTNDIPRLIKLAEERLIIDLNLEIFDVTDDTIVVTGNNRSVPKPADLIVTRDMWLITGTTRTQVLQRSRAFCTSYWPDPTSLGPVKYWFDYDETTWRVVPTPDGNGLMEVIFVKRPPGLTAINTTTWLSTYAGDLLFDCTLMEAEQWIKADDRYGDMRTKYYEEKLPSRRAELRNMMRMGDYNPYRPAAAKVG